MPDLAAGWSGSSAAKGLPRTPRLRLETTARGCLGSARRSSDLELFRELVARAEQSLLEGEEAPSLAEIERLMRVKRPIDALETIEWARRLGHGEE